jgi:hypothetical protein
MKCKILEASDWLHYDFMILAQGQKREKNDSSITKRANFLVSLVASISIMLLFVNSSVTYNIFAKQNKTKIDKINKSVAQWILDSIVDGLLKPCNLCHLVLQFSQCATILWILFIFLLFLCVFPFHLKFSPVLIVFA